MFSELKSYLMGLWLLFFGVASASDFSLQYHDDDTYLLETPATHKSGILVHADGSRELEMLTVHDVVCTDRSFLVPVIRAYIETGISTGERLEYFILESIDGHHVPVKSITSFNVLDRETGDQVSRHILSGDAESIPSGLCHYIQTDSEHDNPITLVER